MTPEEIESEALKLDLELRSKLVQRLTKSLEELSENEKERLWLQEAMKRSREMRAAQRPPPRPGEGTAEEGPAEDLESESSADAVEAPVTRPLPSDGLAPQPATETPRISPRRKLVPRPAARARRRRPARKPAPRKGRAKSRTRRNAPASARKKSSRRPDPRKSRKTHGRKPRSRRR